MNVASLKQYVRRSLPAPIIEMVSKRLPQATAPGSEIYQQALRGKAGLEIGGPSGLFQRFLPLYEVVAELDGANFGCDTMWEGRISAGRTFRYGDRVGMQYIAEATDLCDIASARYDFVLSSNCLEHVANPIKALREWIRVTKPGGRIVLVLPIHTSNFDHRRPLTPFSHLMDDFRNDVTEHDLTHLDELLALHDFARNPSAPGETREAFRARCLDNFAQRGMHHHVFDRQSITQMMEFCGLELVRFDRSETDYIALGLR